MPPTEPTLIAISPPGEMGFDYSGRACSRVLAVKNVSETEICVKIKTTAVKSYNVRPPGGVLKAGQSTAFQVVCFFTGN